jgi:hypothetical protein
MRRHGWALYLGLLAGGPVAAQPPANSEHYPPPLELPGVVVGQMRGSPPTAPAATHRTSLKPAEPATTLLKSDAPSPTATAEVAPVDSGTPVDGTPVGLPAPAVALPPGPGCPASPPVAKCGAGIGSIQDWLLFRSRARQSGHYYPPYRPPLLAWFPCEPGYGYGARVAPTCAVPAVVPIGPAPVIANVPGSIGPPAALRLPACPDKEALTSFEKIGDGLGYAPGGAPMAEPTTQVKPSKWRPR